MLTTLLGIVPSVLTRFGRNFFLGWKTFPIPKRISSYFSYFFFEKSRIFFCKGLNKLKWGSLITFFFSTIFSGILKNIYFFQIGKRWIIRDFWKKKVMCELGFWGSFLQHAMGRFFWTLISHRIGPFTLYAALRTLWHLITKTPKNFGQSCPHMRVMHSTSCVLLPSSRKPYFSVIAMLGPKMTYLRSRNTHQMIPLCSQHFKLDFLAFSSD